MRISFSTSLYTVSACTIVTSATLSQCTVTQASGYVILTPSVKTSGTSYTVTVTVKNPYSVQSISGITCSVLNSAGSSLESTTFTTGSTGFALVAGTISSTTLASSSSVLAATSTWTLTSTLTNGITTSGRIRLYFPTHTAKYNGYGETADNRIWAITTSSTITCKQNSVALGCNFQITQNSDNTYVFIQVFPTSNLAAGTTLQIIIALAKNPLSSRPYTGITMQTFDYLNPIDSQTTGISLTTTTSQQAGKQAFIYNDKVLVSDTSAEYFFQFTTVNPIPKGGYLVIEVPAIITTFSNIGSWSFTLYDTTLSDVTFSRTLQVITVKGMFTDYVTGGTDLYFRIKGWTNPSVTTAASFSIKTYEALTGTGYLIDTFVSLNIQASLGSTYILRAEPQDNTKITEYPATYFFQIQCKNQILASEWLELVFPTDFQIADSTICNVTGFYNKGVTCVSSSSTRKITIKLLSLNTISAMNTLEFTVAKVIRNPSHLNATGQLIINHVSSSGVVDSGKFIYPKSYFTASSIATFTITPVSTQAGVKNVNYTFSVTPQGKVSLGAYLQLTMASDISIYDKDSIEFSCGGTLLGFTSSKVLCAVRDDKIFVQKGFQTLGTTADPPTINFTISNLNNPRSLAPSKPFGMSIYDSLGRLIYIWNITTSPTVQMKTAGKPSAFSVTRSSTQNSVQTDYHFSITPSLYFQAGDIIKIIAPTPIVFSNISTCTGIQALATSLTCTVSTDKTTIDVKIATKSLRNLQSISSGTVVSLKISNVTNPYSQKQTTSGFQFYATTAAGYTIESWITGGPQITNTAPGSISPLLASVTPSNFIQSEQATYTFQFVPTGYEQNMKLKVYVPKEISIIGTSVTCRGVHGTDKVNLTCTTNTTEKSITITDGFSVREVIPKNITFTLSYLKNPTLNVLTSSFNISTITKDNYAIDSITSSLEINFFCTYPCKSCLTENPQSCQSCYGFVTEKSFYINKCYVTCPSGLYTDANNNCTQCQSPCKECDQNNGLCLACIDKYELYTDGRCYKKVYIANLYPFPFSVAAIAMTIAVFVTLCFAKNTKFFQSVIAMIAIPEIGAWGTVIYMLYANSSMLIFLLAAGALLLHIIINVIYAILHWKLILRHSDEYHLDYYERHLHCNRCSNIFSLLLSFKFNVIQISFCGGGDHLKGHWNRKQWCIWNLIAIGYIITSCALMIFALVLQLLATLDEMRTFTWYITVDTIFITIYMAVLLIFLTLLHLPCCRISDRERQPYNKVLDNSNSQMDDSKSDIDKNSIKKLKELDIHKSKQETDIGLTPRPNQTEIQMLEKFMEKLQKNGIVLDPKDKQEIIEQRKKIIQNKKNPFQQQESSDFETVRDDQQYLQNKAELEKERKQLEDLKKDFLDEVDKRVQKRLEDWELSSQVSMRQSKVQDPDHAFETLRATPNKIMMNGPLILEEDQFNQTMKPLTQASPEQSPRRNIKAVYEKLDRYLESRVIYDRQFEPINNKKAVFENVQSDEREKSSNEVMIGKVTNRVFEQSEYKVEIDDQQDTEDDMEEIKIEDDVTQRPPRPQSPQDLDEEERDVVDVQDINKKNVLLYSDKSESSIDEMMEDTPSNYNIPNGRLDGKSIGLKALLLQAKKQGIKLDVTENSQDGTLHYNSQQQQQSKILSPQNLLTKAPRNKEEEEKKFINNLFKGPNAQQPNIMQNPLSNRDSQQNQQSQHNTLTQDLDNDIEEQKSARKKKKIQNNKQFIEPNDEEGGATSNRLNKDKSNKGLIGNNRSSQPGQQDNQNAGMSRIRSNNYL